VKGLRSSHHGDPDHGLALKQHGRYVDTLSNCGLDLLVLPADEDFPDSAFVEDTALLTPEVAIITNPGAPSRRGETRSIKEVINGYYDHVECIELPGKLEAGDVMMAGNHYYIGLSERTNIEGAKQLTAILSNYGMSASLVDVPGMLHLKTGISFLENNNMLAVDILAKHTDFLKFNIIKVPEKESYAANSLWINDRVIVPTEYPETLENIREAGYDTITLDMSEFRKLDGGLSCLSLRF
jgi:dimethylargininase